MWPQAFERLSKAEFTKAEFKKTFNAVCVVMMMARGRHFGLMRCVAVVMVGPHVACLIRGMRCVGGRQSWMVQSMPCPLLHL